MQTESSPKVLSTSGWSSNTSPQALAQAKAFLAKRTNNPNIQFGFGDNGSNVFFLSATQVGNGLFVINVLYTIDFSYLGNYSNPSSSRDLRFTAGVLGVGGMLDSLGQTLYLPIGNEGFGVLSSPVLALSPSTTYTGYLNIDDLSIPVGVLASTFSFNIP